MTNKIEQVTVEITLPLDAKLPLKYFIDVSPGTINTVEVEYKKEENNGSVLASYPTSKYAVNSPTSTQREIEITQFPNSKDANEGTLSSEARNIKVIIEYA